MYGAGRAQNYSNKGKDFWITYPMHIDGVTSAMGIYITSDLAANGTIQVGSQTISFSLAANSVVRKFIGPQNSGDASNSLVYLDQTDGVKSGAGIHVVSDNPVAVYAHIIKTSRSAATLVIPTSVWGKQYTVPSYANAGGSQNGPGGIPAISVVAAEPNTEIEIKPAISTRSGKPAGAAYRVMLVNPGDAYQVQFSGSNADISGTTVQSVASSGGSCKKIAVFSSVSWSAFGCPNATSGDNLYQQLFPTASWGKNFLTAPAKTRTLDIFRVFVSDPSAVVTKTENGVKTTLTGLQNGFYEYTTGNPTYIQSDKPASVVQYFTTQSCQANATIGDPEMVLLNPVEQTINNITVFSAHRNWVPTNQSAIDHCYLNIIIKTNSTGSFKINGANPSASFVAIPGTDYSYLQEEVTSQSVTNPVQTLSADSSFSAIAYGFGNVESYGYNAGTNVRDFSATTVFQNPFKRIDSAVTCANTPFQFAVPLAYQPTTMTWDFSSAPNISPSATLNPTPAHDSISQGLYYYSPRNTYTFSKANTAAVRDTIKLYTTSATPDGCGNTSQVYAIPVKVNEQPGAVFSFVHSGCVSDSVQFTDKSSYAGTLVQRLWDYGDGSTENRSNGDPFAKKYANAGVFTIKYKTVADVGCASAETSQSITITSKPVAKFNAAALICEGTEAGFTDASSTTLGTIVKWIWDLDDGKGGFINNTNAAVKANYTSSGTRHPALQVETSNGCKSDVYDPGVLVNPAPKPGFILPEVCLNDAGAQFTDTSKIAEGSIVSWAWNLNAGTPPVSPGPSVATSTAKNPQVKYNKSDYYKVSLTVVSALGCSATRTEEFTVNGSIPKAAFELANAAPYCGTKPVQLRNNSTVDFGIVTRMEIYWDYSNAPEVKETIETPVSAGIYPHQYPDPASPRLYTIRMLAYSGGNSCVSETSRTITVYPQPKAVYSVSATQLCYGETVNFTDKSSTGSSPAASWVWDLGKGDVSGQQHPSKQYNDSGIEKTSMHFINKDGCISDTAYQTLTVYPNPQVVLQHKTVVLDGGTITLKPEWVYGKDLQYLWTPASYLSSDTAVAPKATPVDDITYKLNITAEGGCTATDTIFIRVLKGPVVPNVFSPNGDGINDTWHIKYLDGYPGATLDVYDRGGQLLLHSVGYDREWDGTYQGKALAVGTYYYIINPRNGKPVISGSVTIIK